MPILFGSEDLPPFNWSPMGRQRARVKPAKERTTKEEDYK
jgi:hypothetical protein